MKKDHEIVQGYYIHLRNLTEDQCKAFFRYQIDNKLYPYRSISSGLGHIEEFFDQEDGEKILAYLKDQKIINQSHHDR